MERCNKTKEGLAVVGLGNTTDSLETQEGLRTGLSTSVRKKDVKRKSSYVKNIDVFRDINPSRSYS